MAVTIDIGDPEEVHVKDKIDVGQRLALVARRQVYGEDIVSSGPTFESLRVDGKRAVITFGHVGGGLVIGVPPWAPSGKIPPVAHDLRGFAIAGPDRKWSWAKVKIEGSTVAVRSDDVPNPVAVRYAWADNPPAIYTTKRAFPRRLSEPTSGSRLPATRRAQRKPARPVGMIGCATPTGA